MEEAVDEPEVVEEEKKSEEEDDDDDGVRREAWLFVCSVSDSCREDRCCKIHTQDTFCSVSQIFRWTLHRSSLWSQR